MTWDPKWEESCFHCQEPHNKDTISVTIKYEGVRRYVKVHKRCHEEAQKNYWDALGK